MDFFSRYFHILIKYIGIIIKDTISNSGNSKITDQNYLTFHFDIHEAIVFSLKKMLEENNVSIKFR